MLEQENDNLLHADASGENKNVSTNADQTTEHEDAETVNPTSNTESGITDTIDESTENIINAIADDNAAESEDQSIIGRHEIPLEDFESMTLQQLI